MRGALLDCERPPPKKRIYFATNGPRSIARLRRPTNCDPRPGEGVLESTKPPRGALAQTKSCPKKWLVRSRRTSHFFGQACAVQTGRSGTIPHAQSEARVSRKR